MSVGPEFSRHSLLRGGGWAIVGTTLGMALGLGVNGLLARMLTSTDLGLYFLLVSFTTFFATFAQGGVLQVLLRRIALAKTVSGKVQAGWTLRNAFIYVAIGLTIVTLILPVAFGDQMYAIVSDAAQPKRSSFCS